MSAIYSTFTAYQAENHRCTELVQYLVLVPGTSSLPLLCVCVPVVLALR
jgi:hypothetical protein